jgi:2,4-dienoyl-CoA reductase-like NADH-dependent reductase (Old Yellow Enzyme family)/NADPH-dependent 2,4-dienoyl-CoA reductase/sulfur reductase-like enzyme
MYEQLLSPGRIGRLKLRNRVLMTPMGSSLGDGDGFCGERIQAYYAERARGGVALQIMGSVAIAWPVSGVIPRQAAISDDRHIPGMAALASAVHRHGGKLALQLHFGGLMSMMDINAGRPVWTPSIPQPKYGDMMDAIFPDELEGLAAPHGEIKYKVMTAADVAELVGLFASAAARAREAGVDGVEIHAGHGYIVSSFLSPITNRRSDDYGGSVENRSRLLVEIIRGIRAEVGAEYPVWPRIDSQEFCRPDGISLADARRTAELAESAGADAIHVSAYADAAQGIAHSSAHTPHQPGLLIPNARAIKAAVSVPVITIGRIEPEVADRCIRDGDFDFVAMGRKLLAEPHLPNKLASGEASRVRPCIYCYTCNSQLYIGNAVRCAVNPETGWERELAPAATGSRLRVVVVGGGPAGLEAARRLALSGHEVVLLERSSALGGELRHAAATYEPNRKLLQWLPSEVRALGVDVRLDVDADAARVRALEPDAVIVATGARRAPSPIPGASLALTLDDLDLDAADVARVRSIDRQSMPLARRVSVIGHELIALELAQHLAELGHDLTVLHGASQFGRGAALVRRWRILHGLRERGAALLPGARNIEILRSGVRYENSSGQLRTVDTDHVVIAFEGERDTTLVDELRVAGVDVQAIGDCAGVEYIDGAMRGAAAAVARITAVRAPRVGARE